MADKIPEGFRGVRRDLADREDVELVNLDHDAPGVNWWAGRVAIECPRCEADARLDDLIRYGCTCGADVQAMALFDGRADRSTTWWCPLCSEDVGDRAEVCTDPDECVRSQNHEGRACGQVVCPECRATCRELDLDDVQGSHG